MPVQDKTALIFLLTRDRDRIRSLGVKRIGLFGSFVREEQNKASDVDLLVEFEEGKKTFDNFMELSFLLEDTLERKVELVTPESLSPYIRPHIFEEIEYVPIAS